MKKYKMHRFVLGYDGPLQVDHVNRNKFDNRKENLRIVSGFINAQNNGKEGISFDKKHNKWRAEIQRYRKYFYVGSYKTKEEAINARNKMIEEIDKHKDEYLYKVNNKDKDHFTGIYSSSHGKWVAKFCANGKTYHVGTFKTKEEAISARTTFILKHKNKTSA